MYVGVCKLALALAPMPHPSYWLSQRMRLGDRKSFSARVMAFSTGSIALGVAIMLLAFAILQGFRANIESKVYSFDAHLVVSPYTRGGVNENTPLSLDSPIAQQAQQVEGVAHVQSFIAKPALMRSEKEVHGVVLKGAGPDFSLASFAPNLVEGRFVRPGADSTASLEVVLSQRMARLLEVKPGDEVSLYFMQDPPRQRNVTVVGLYETGLEDFDEVIVWTDRLLLQQMNRWSDQEVSGLEILVKNPQEIPQVQEALIPLLQFDQSLAAIQEVHPTLFEWLALIGRNVEILMVLLTLVACFNMISTLLMLMLERTQTIGLLKALGASNRQIRQVFVLHAMRFVGRGLLWGNALGLGLCALQYYTHLFPLDPESYYISYVPIQWNGWAFLGVNVLTALLTFASLWLPTLFITRVSPVKAIRWE